MIYFHSLFHSIYKGSNLFTMKSSVVICPITQKEFNVQRCYDEGDEYEVDVYIGCFYAEYVKELGCVLSFEDSEEIIVLDSDGSFSFRTTKEENEEVFKLCIEESRESVLINNPCGIHFGDYIEWNELFIHATSFFIGLNTGIVPGEMYRMIIEINMLPILSNIKMARMYLFDNFVIVSSYSESPYVVVIRKKVDDFK